MITTYRLHVNEHSEQLIDSIKAAFKNKTVEIIVTDATDETTYLLQNKANRKQLFESMKEVEKGKGIILSCKYHYEYKMPAHRRQTI